MMPNSRMSMGSIFRELKEEEIVHQLLEYVAGMDGMNQTTHPMYKRKLIVIMCFIKLNSLNFLGFESMKIQ